MLALTSWSTTSLEWTGRELITRHSGVRAPLPDVVFITKAFEVTLSRKSVVVAVFCGLENAN